MRRLLRVSLLVCLLGLSAFAGPIVISVDTANPGSVGSLSADAYNVLAVAWYLPAITSPVNINVQFEDLFGGGLFDAYLMNGIGPQADPLTNEIASTQFTASFGLALINLFSNLTLDPGYYYLVIGTTDPNSVGGWGATTDPLVTTAPDVLQGDLSGIQFYASGLDVASYLPASNFAIDDGVASGQLMYEVSVPEPSTALLILTGGVAMAFIKRRRGLRRG